jgi:hypothetical protein
MPLTLRDIVSSGNYKLTKFRLDADKTVDLLREDGILIQFAIRSGNTELVKYLLCYFEENQLSEYDADSLDAVMLRNQMRHAIEGVGSWIKSDAMRSLLSSYSYSDSDADEGEQSDDDLQANNAATVVASTLQQQALPFVHHATDTASRSVTSWLQEVPEKVIDANDNAGTVLLGQGGHEDL